MNSATAQLELPALRERISGAMREIRVFSDKEAEELGEDRLMFSGFTWEGYQALDDALGHDRSSPRLYFFEGEVEIMSTSAKHEELKKWLADLIAQFFLAKGIRAYPRGQATIKHFKDAGAEPDESWTLGQRKDTPDLVLEIALTSGGLPKLEIYQRFGVPEVWFWRKGKLEVWTLTATGYTGPHEASTLLPAMPLRQLEACAVIEDWTDAIEGFRAALV